MIKKHLLKLYNGKKDINYSILESSIFHFITLALTTKPIHLKKRIYEF